MLTAPKQILFNAILCINSLTVQCSDSSLGSNSFIHSVFCLTTVPKPPLKRFLHIVRSRASSFKWEYPLLSLSSSSSFLRLLPRLLVTAISPFIFPSITCFRRQFPRKMWPIQLAFRFLISCRIGSNYTILSSRINNTLTCTGCKRTQQWPRLKKIPTLVFRDWEKSPHFSELAVSRPRSEFITSEILSRRSEHSAVTFS